MIEYKLLGKDNLPVTLDQIREVSGSIEELFPETDKNNLGGKFRKTYGVNGETFHIYYGARDTRVFLPLKYQESIKEKLEVVAELKFKEI